MEDIILKLAWLGFKWENNFTELSDWLYKNFNIFLEIRKNDICIYLEHHLLVIIFINSKDEDEIFLKSMEHVLKMWKCKDGILEGPSLENWEEPEEWT